MPHACSLRRERARPAKADPAVGDVVVEIGIILAIHLGVALAVILALGAPASV